MAALAFRQNVGVSIAWRQPPELYCLDPTHFVTWLLVNLPHLCIPHNPPHLLPILFSLCWFCSPVPVLLRIFPVVSCPPCPVQPCQAWLPACFPLQGRFCLLHFILLIKSTFSWTTESWTTTLSLHPITLTELQLLGLDDGILEFLKGKNSFTLDLVNKYMFLNEFVND